MTIYLLLLILLLFLSYYYDYRNNLRGKTFWYNSVCIILILLAGLRNHVGGDTFVYIDKFQNLPTLSEILTYGYNISDITQPLWFFINVLCKSFLDDFVVVQLFHAVVCNVLLFRFIKKTTHKVFVSVLLSFCVFWWNFNFEIMRESLCVVIFLNALLELKNHNIKRYIIYTIPALFIHYFSFIIIAITIIAYFLPKKIYVSLSAILVATLLFLDTNTISAILGMMLAYTGEDLATLGTDYLASDIYGQIQLSFFGVLSFILKILIPIIILFSNNKLKFLDNVEFKVVILYILLLIIQSKIVIFQRFINYLTPIIIVLTINFLSNRVVRLKLQYYFVLLTLIINTLLTIKSFYEPNPLERTNRTYDCRYIPYTSIFEEPDPVRESIYG